MGAFIPRYPENDGGDCSRTLCATPTQCTAVAHHSASARLHVGIHCLPVAVAGDRSFLCGVLSVLLPYLSCFPHSINGDNYYRASADTTSVNKGLLANCSNGYRGKTSDVYSHQEDAPIDQQAIATLTKY